jgi:hypothetical protein
MTMCLSVRLFPYALQYMDWLMRRDEMLPTTSEYLRPNTTHVHWAIERTTCVDKAFDLGQIMM